MFSFFSKKKTSPDTTPPEEIIPGADTTDPNDGNEFIFVERKPNQPSPVGGNGIYPSMPPPIYAGYPLPPGNYPIGGDANFSPKKNFVPVPYLQGVPFNLSPGLSTNTSYDFVQMEVDGILAFMTKQMQFENDYDFKMEQEICSICDGD